MHISKIDINNFRGLNSLLIEDLKMVNIFLGKNNVGKTSILEAIFVSLGPSNPQLTVNIDLFRNLQHTSADDFSFIFNEFDYSKKIEIVVNFQYEELVRTLSITPLNQKTVNVSEPTVMKDLSADAFSSNLSEGLSADGLNLNFSIKRKHGKTQNYASRIQFNGGNIIGTQTQNYKEEIKGTLISSNMSVLFAGLGQRFQKLIINKKESEIVEFLKLIDNSIIGLTLGNNIIYVDTGFGKRFPVNLLGDGIIKLIAILVAIYDNANGIVLIDEYSNGLHHTALKTLWRAVFAAAKKNRTQIFLTSHDYEALKHLKQVLCEEDYQINQPETRAYTIQRASDNSLKSYKYEYDQLEYSIEQDIEIR